MILWRLSPAHYQRTALDGKGAAVTGGRWNSRGIRAAYLSLDASTTVLEALTKFYQNNAPKHEYRLLKFEYEGGFEQMQVSDLPRGWDHPANASIARTIGDPFLLEQRAGILLVPSVVMKEATNAVFNPLHPDAGKARLIDNSPFTFDDRLWAR